MAGFWPHKVMGATDSGRRLWKKAVVVAVCGAAVIAGLMVWMVAELRSDIPETVTSSSFVACGQSYELLSGYLAFDYGSRPGAEVPSGHTIYSVQSMKPGVAPPGSADGIFGSWPTEISELVVGAPYGDWLQKIAVATDPSLLGSGVVVGGVRYDDDCRVSVHLDAQRGRLEPRPGDWAVVIYEARGGDTALGDDLEAWRSSGLTD